VRLEARRVAAFLRDPERARVVLLYGEDAGLIRERAGTLVRAVVGAPDDPFRVATVARAADLPAEAASVSLSGGRRVVRLPEAGEEARGAVAEVLEGHGDALVLLEAPGLAPSRSRLLKVVESHPQAVAIACYPEEGGRLADTVRAWLAGYDVSVDEHALSWLASRLGADHALNRREVEKLALYAGPGGRVDLAAAEAAVGDVAGLSLDDALFAATAGDAATADRALERALAEGATPVGVIRAGLSHLSRLQRAALAVSGGATAAAAAREARVFFRREQAFIRALKLLPPDALAEACQTFFRGEREAKRTGAPATALCRHLVLELAGRAARLT
jgi:DNA polymerase-3 subunit delta